MATVDSLVASFFDNPQHWDIVIKFGDCQIRAHKVILAQQSGYFATAFFSRFQVASSPVIDLGDEDDSELIVDTIRYLYRHGSIQNQLLGRDVSLTMDKLVDIYLMADKYDIPKLRRSATSKLSLLAHSRLRTSRINATSLDQLVDCIARVCGPDSLQSADTAMKTRVMEICQRNSVALLKNKTFLQRYRRGELFDVGSATAFGMGLGRLVLTSNGARAEEADGFPNVKSVYQYTPDRYMINFFNDQRLSDVTVTYSGKKTLAHKIILATHSSYFQEVLGRLPTVSGIDLGSEHDTAATAAFLEDMYTPYCRTSGPGHSLVFFAEMYLLAKRYGREDAVRVYWNQCSNTLGDNPFTDENLAGVAALCGPNSSRYADTPLPDTAFEDFCSNIHYMDDRERETLKKKLEEGSMFNATFLRRFAVDMLDSFLRVYNERSSTPEE